VGLDVGHSTVAVLEMQETSVLRWTTVPLPAGAVASGVVRDDRAVAEGVRRALSAIGAAGQAVVSAASGAACFIRRLQFPDLAPKDLLRAVRWEAERLLPYPFDTAAVDFDVLTRRSEQGRPVIEVVLVAARTDVVEGLRRAVEAGGAKLAAVDAAPLARLRIYAREVAPPGILLVHLGSHWAELTASDEHGLVFTRTVAIGTAEPAADLAPDLPRPVRGASGVRTLLEEVVRSVRFFETQAGTQIGKIVLTGSGAEDPNAIAIFAAADLPPAVVIDPLAGLPRGAAVPPPPGLRLATAAGLAMRASQVPEPKETPWR
jgi:type IV pilus assembly protein PilM